MPFEKFGQDFQSRVYCSYEALHGASAPFLLSQGLITDPGKGALAGEFIVADSLAGAAETLPLAALLAGACFVGVDADAEAAKQLLRRGHCDFVVNSLDEALRILKNELRQKAPVAVCLTGDVPAVFAEMARRGVSPDLLVYAQSEGDLLLLRQGMTASGTALLALPQECDVEQPRGEAAPVLTEWALPKGNAAVLAKVDAVAMQLFDGSDRPRRRWLEAAPRYIPRQSPMARVCSLSAQELERFVDGVSGRIMSGEITGPVVVSTAHSRITLGNEAAA